MFASGNIEGLGETKLAVLLGLIFKCLLAGVFPPQRAHLLSGSYSHDAYQLNCLPPISMSGQHCENYDVKRETAHTDRSCT